MQSTRNFALPTNPIHNYRCATMPTLARGLNADAPNIQSKDAMVLVRILARRQSASWKQIEGAKPAINARDPMAPGNGRIIDFVAGLSPFSGYVLVDMSEEPKIVKHRSANKNP